MSKLSGNNEEKDCEMLTTTLDEIRIYHPCVDGWKKVSKMNGNGSFPISSILDSNDLDDTLWVMGKLSRCRDILERWSVWCAEQSLQYTNDIRVHDCVSVTKKFLNGETTEKELKYAAAEAAEAAEAAVCAARAAAEAAEAAVYTARAAEAAAVCAARAAVFAARAAEAAEAAVYAAMIGKLRQVLDAGEWVE